MNYLGLILFILLLFIFIAWFTYEKQLINFKISLKSDYPNDIIILIMLTSILYIFLLWEINIIWIVFLLEFQSFIILGSYYLFKENKKKNSVKGIEGSINYIFPAFFSFFLMLMYILFNIINVNNDYIIEVIMNIILVLSILTKMGAFPLFFWVSIVFQNICYSTLLLISVVSKVFMITIILFYLSTIYSSFLFLGVFSIAISSLFMLSFSNIKKFLAFSSIGNVGWILVLLSSNSTNKLIFNLNISEILIIFFFIYAFNFILFCLIIKENKNNHIFNITKNFLNGQQFIYILVFTVVSLFSMAGIPPLLGFFGKYIIFISYFNHNVISTLLLVFFSIVFIFCYVRPVTYLIRFNKPYDNIKSVYYFNKYISNFIVFLVIFNFYLMFCIFYLY